MLDMINVFIHGSSTVNNILIGAVIVLAFAVVLILGIMYFHRDEMNAMFKPGTPYIRQVWLYFTSTKPGKHAMKGIMMFVGAGGAIFAVLFALFMSPEAEAEQLQLFSQARIELGVIRAPNNAYAFQGEKDALGDDWVSHGELSLSVIKYACVDVNAIVWFHQSAAFVRDARTLDASGITLSCTIPLNRIGF